MSDRIDELKASIEDAKNEKRQVESDALAAVSPDSVPTEEVELLSGQTVSVRKNLTKAAEDAQANMQAEPGTPMSEVVPNIALLMEEMIQGEFGDAELWVEYYHKFGLDQLMDELDRVMDPFYSKQEAKAERNEKFRQMGNGR